MFVDIRVFFFVPIPKFYDGDFNKEGSLYSLDLVLTKQRYRGTFEIEVQATRKQKLAGLFQTLKHSDHGNAYKSNCTQRISNFHDHG